MNRQLREEKGHARKEEASGVEYRKIMHTK